MTKKHLSKKKKKLINLDVETYEDLGTDSEDEDESAKYEQRHFLLPSKNHRTLIIGPSGSGKTCLLMSYIMKYLSYDKIYLYSTHLDQVKYRRLIRFFKKIENTIFDQTGLQETILHTGSCMDDVIPVDEYDKTKRTLIIFDDMIMCEDPDGLIPDIFVRSRHKNCSVIYLSQMYFKVNRHIRLNCSHVAIFNVQNKRELNMLNQELAYDLSKDEFKRVYLEAVAEKYSFLYIDRESVFKPLKYRKRLNCLFDDL